MKPGFRSNMAGFSLIELLVAVFVLVLGVLGFTSLQTEGIKQNRHADLRTRAMQSAYNIADRMRANRAAAVQGSYAANAAPTVTYNCQSNFTGTSVQSKCSPAEMARADLALWFTAMAVELPGGAGAISCTDSDAGDTDACSRGSIHNIQVQWREYEANGFQTKTFAMDVQP